MNPVVTLDELANGVQVCERVEPLDPVVLDALRAAVTTTKTVSTVSQPVNARTIDNTTLAGGVENVTEFTFTNNTAVTITYWFTALFNEPGDASDFRVAGNSAFDFPAAQGSGPNPEAGGSDLRVFNKMAIANPGGFIVGRIEVTTSNTGSQKNQNLVINTQDVARDACVSRRLAPLCPACPENNGDGDTWVVVFRCPLAVGGMVSFGYPVLAGQSVTFRVTSIGQGVAQYKAIGDACGC